MHIVHLVLIGIFGLFGLGVLSTGFTAMRADGSRVGLGMVVGGVCYIAGACFAYALDAWWPLIAGFAAAWIARLALGEPGWNR
jgi:hypothetical protein